jgi:ubiquinone/menaquinone biosynthesis C-methylase UbiE
MPATRWTTWTVAVLAVAAISISGLAAGWLLSAYNQTLGFDTEAARIAEVLRVGPGMNVGDIRAGSGIWTVDLARRVRPSGQVYATVGPNPAHEVYETIAAAGVDNVTVITRTPGNLPRLPVACCEAILVRAVFHDFRDRRQLAQSLFLNTRVLGRVAVIDFDEGTPEHGSGHGLDMATAVAEMTGAGFRVEQRIEDWAGNAYCLVFVRPAA